MLALARDTERIVNSAGGRGMGTGTRATRRWRERVEVDPEGVPGPGSGRERWRRNGTGWIVRKKREGKVENKKKRDAHWAARPPALGRACIRPRNLDCRHTSTSAALHHETRQHTNSCASASAYHLLDVSRIRIVNASPGAPPGTLCTGPGCNRHQGRIGIWKLRRKVVPIIESAKCM